MKILVAGAGGQVGSALCRLAGTSGIEVIGLNSVDLDIADQDSIDRALTEYKPDLLVNAAAYTAVDLAEKEPDKARLINSTAVGYLAVQTTRRHIPLIHLSTDYVFDGTKQSPYTEDDLTCPLGVYGKTKLEGELALQQHQDQFVILRTSWVFGREGKNFPKTMLRLAQEKKEWGVVGDQTGRPTYADDIAETIFAIGRCCDDFRKGKLSSPPPWGIYHYGGSPPSNWHDVAIYTLTCAYEAGVITSIPKISRLRSDEYPVAARRPLNSVLDCRKISLHFPQVGLSDWRSGVKNIVGAIERKAP